MSDRYYRPSCVNVDLNAISDNFKTIGKRHPNKTVMAVIKANGYGLGSVRIAQHLMEHGAEFFAVATLSEAIELRMHGIKAKLLVLGVVEPQYIRKASKHRVAVTVPSLEWLEEVKSHLKQSDKPIWTHVKLDTGMNRIGIRTNKEYRKVIEHLNQDEQFIFEGVYTHFSCADMDTDYTEKQYTRFMELVEKNEKPPFIHCQNSAASLLFDAPFCNSLRLGISLYGYYPSEYVREKTNVKLKPAMQLVSAVSFVKQMAKGDKVSYGATYSAQDSEYIATFPIGYADGYLRGLGGTYINVEGHQCEVVGRICMDQIMAKVPAGIKTGAKAILIDNQSDSPQSIERAAEKLNTINYEVLTSLSRRLPKVYFSDGKEEVYNELLK